MLRNPLKILLKYKFFYKISQHIVQIFMIVLIDFFDFLWGRYKEKIGHTSELGIAKFDVSFSKKFEIASLYLDGLTSINQKAEGQKNVPSESRFYNVITIYRIYQSL